ncbi:MAG: hypothetical protein FIB07_16970 [Candidatus Methanoperedens sp.]|nr:hypothetical protein [Candidatus Methanoperedens sp.]
MTQIKQETEKPLIQTQETEKPLIQTQETEKPLIQTQETEKPLIQALLQEYANSVQLYTNTITVTYTRVYGFLAVHSALIAGVFFAPTDFDRSIISIIGVVLAFFTILTVEHVWQFSMLRVAQMREIEERLNRLINANEIFKLTTFKNQYTLFFECKDVTFPLTHATLPNSQKSRLLIKYMPYQADKIITYLLGIWWIYYFASYTFGSGYEFITTVIENLGYLWQELKSFVQLFLHF